MLCPNCKTENDDSANFCVNCRTSLKDAPAEEPVAAPVVEETPVVEEEAPVAAAPAEPVAEPVVEPVAPVAPAAPVAPVATPAASSSEKPNFFAIMVASVLKPMTTFKENLPKFSELKNAAIISIIVVAMATILSTITSVVGIVRTEECVENCGGSLSSLFSTDDDKKEAKIETKWEWKRLEKYDWFKNVGQTLLFNALTVIVISGAYFGMSKAFKSEKANIYRMMTVVSLGLIPTVVVTFLVPMIGAINTTFAGVLNIAALVYSASIILVGLNEESGVEGDKKVYLNIASAACAAVAYYIIMRVMYGEMADLMFKSIFDLSGGGLSGLTGGASSSYSIDADLDLDDYTKYLNF